MRANNWIVWGLLLALQLVGFLVTKLTLHKPALELVGPYFVTFVAPVLIGVAIASLLRKWGERRRPPPKLLAFCWSLLVATLVAAIDGAIFYYGVKFEVMNPTVGDIVFVMAACILSASIPAYYRALPTIVARQLNNT
jgi:uncharacterized membrane protein YhaH (DUF805 family)